MKTSDNIYDLVKNASTFAQITPGSYYLDKPLQIPQKASQAGIFRLICWGATFYCSSHLFDSPTDVLVTGGTFFLGSNNVFATSEQQESLTAFFEYSVIVTPSSNWETQPAQGLNWHCESLGL